MLIYSHNKNSEGAKRLAREFGCKRISHENSRFTGHRSPWVVNWGSSAIPLAWKNRVRLLNDPEAVQRVSNKSTFFEDMNDIPQNWLPSFTLHIADAAGMIADGHKVVCRTLLNASGGRGIVIASTVYELIDAPLDVHCIPKAAESTVHVFRKQYG